MVFSKYILNSWIYMISITAHVKICIISYFELNPVFFTCNYSLWIWRWISKFACTHLVVMNFNLWFQRSWLGDHYWWQKMLHQGTAGGTIWKGWLLNNIESEYYQIMQCVIVLVDMLPLWCRLDIGNTGDLWGIQQDCWRREWRS